MQNNNRIEPSMITTPSPRSESPPPSPPYVPVTPPSSPTKLTSFAAVPTSSRLAAPDSETTPADFFKTPAKFLLYPSKSNSETMELVDCNPTHSVDAVEVITRTQTQTRSLTTDPQMQSTRVFSARQENPNMTGSPNTSPTMEDDESATSSIASKSKTCKCL